MFSRSTLLGLDVKHFFKKWGPNARTSIQLARRVLTRSMLQARAETAACGFAPNPNAMTPETKSELTVYAHSDFSARPIDEETRFTYVLGVETQYLRDQVVDNIARLCLGPDMQVSFYSQASRNSRFERSMGYVFSRNSYMRGSLPIRLNMNSCVVLRTSKQGSRSVLEPIGWDRLRVITGKKRLRGAKEPRINLHSAGYLHVSPSPPLTLSYSWVRTSLRFR